MILPDMGEGEIDNEEALRLRFLALAPLSSLTKRPPPPVAPEEERRGEPRARVGHGKDIEIEVAVLARRSHAVVRSQSPFLSLQAITPETAKRTALNNASSSTSISNSVMHIGMSIGIGSAIADALTRSTVSKAVEASGVNRVARALGVGREAVCRVASGMPTRRGTLALVRQAIAEGALKPGATP